MKMAGFSVLEWKAAGYAPKELMIAGYTVVKLLSAEYRAPELRSAGFTLRELAGAGVPLLELVGTGASFQELRDRVGYNNLCVGWDSVPALYLASPLFLYIELCFMRYQFFKKIRAELRDLSPRRTWPAPQRSTASPSCSWWSSSTSPPWPVTSRCQSGTIRSTGGASWSSSAWSAASSQLPRPYS